MATSGCVSFSTTSLPDAVKPCLKFHPLRQSCLCLSSARICSPSLSVRSDVACRIPAAALFYGNSSRSALRDSKSSSLCYGLAWRNTLPGCKDFSRRVSKTQKSAEAGGVARAHSNERVVSLVIAVAIPFVAGVVDAVVSNPSSYWYKNLKKPSFNPPDWLFGLAWGILYPVMGFASWLVWVEGGFQKQAYPLTAYIVQLVLNLLWPALFFKAHRIKVALIDISALLVAVAATIVLFKPVNPLAANLLIPYLAWVAFATFLNYKYFKLNGSTGDQIVPLTV